MYTLINGSQKINNSNSKYFLTLVSNYLDEYKLFDLMNHNYNDIMDSINQSDTIIIAHPLYVDSPNTITLKFLDYIYDNNINLDNKRLYVIINCGFKEGEHNITALNIIKNWCRKVNLKYSGGLLIGAGEIVGNKHYRFICHKALMNLKKFSINIKNKKLSNDITTTMDLINNKIYCLLANKSWMRKCKLNKLDKNKIKE